jgi:LPXTG-motif cell wall-anchored protein
MSGNVKPAPGLGGGIAATGTAGVVVTQLPETGASTVIAVAIAAVAGLIVWAIVYNQMRRKQA